MEPTILLWLAALIVFIIIEAVTYQLVSIWFAFGTVGGLVAALAGADFNLQMIIFIAVTAVLLFVLRPISKRLIKPRIEKTNADRLIGKDVSVTETVNNLYETGKGKVSGMVWTLRSADNSVIPEGETAVIEKIEGVKLIVKKKEDK